MLLFPGSSVAEILGALLPFLLFSSTSHVFPEVWAGQYTQSVKYQLVPASSLIKPTQLLVFDKLPREMHHCLYTSGENKTTTTKGEKKKRPGNMVIECLAWAGLRVSSCLKVWALVFLLAGIL